MLLILSMLSVNGELYNFSWTSSSRVEEKERGEGPSKQALSCSLAAIIITQHSLNSSLSLSLSQRKAEEGKGRKEGEACLSKPSCMEGSRLEKQAMAGRQWAGMAHMLCGMQAASDLSLVTFNSSASICCVEEGEEQWKAWLKREEES